MIPQTPEHLETLERDMFETGTSVAAEAPGSLVIISRIVGDLPCGCGARTADILTICVDTRTEFSVQMSSLIHGAFRKLVELYISGFGPDVGREKFLEGAKLALSAVLEDLSNKPSEDD